MTLGSVLIKPQPVAVPLAVEVDISEVISDFVEALTRNPEGAAAAAEILAREAEGTLRDFARGFEERIRLADGRIRALFQPLATAVDALIRGVESGDVVDVLGGALEMVAQLLALLSKERITSLVREAFDIVEKDLGLSREPLRDLVTDLAARVIGELKRDVIGGDTSREALARYEFGSALDSLRALFDEEEIQIPVLDAEVVVDLVGRAWDAGRLERLLAWLRDLLSHRDDVLLPLRAVIEARLALRVQVGTESVPAGPGGRVGFSNGPVPGADGPFPPPGQDARDSTFDQNPNDPVAWYASWVAGQVRRYPADTSADINLFRNPDLIGFTYHKVSKETMEAIAYHTAWVMPVVEGILFHAFSMEQGDVLSNLHLLVVDGIDVGLVAAKLRPIPHWAHWTVKPLLTAFLFGFESGWDRVGAPNDPYIWMTGTLADLGEMLLYYRWTRLLRELLLSVLTLCNNSRDEFARLREAAPAQWRLLMDQSRNVDCHEGLCYAWAELGMFLLPLIFRFTSRDWFGFVSGSFTGTFWAVMFGSAGLSIAFNYLAIFLARLLAGEFFGDGLRYAALPLKTRLFGPYRFGTDFSSGGAGAESVASWIGTPLAFLFSLASNVLDGPVYWFMLTAGSTDDGKYCVDPDAVSRFSFQGYPAGASSPYLLPWKSGDLQQCVQGNLGMWSHNPRTSNQMYSYDFGHNLGTEVLCSRPGILTVLTDTNPDNNTANWNIVEVMHLIVNPASGGLAAVPVPANIAAVFADGVTPIPAGTLFPPYWFLPPGAAAGAFQPLPGLPNPMPLHPSAAILPGATPDAPGSLAGAPAYYAGLNGFNAGTTFAFIDPAIDRAIAGKAAGATFSDGSAIPVANGLVGPNVAVPPPPLTLIDPPGTSYLATGGGNTAPMYATFATYGHCIFGFMRINSAPASPAPGGGITASPRPSGLVDVYRSGTPAQVLGLFVPQGRVIALSGDTGVSAHNHLHHDVNGTTNGAWSIPFSYRDAGHGIEHGIWKAPHGGGVPQAFTFYKSQNNRIAPS